MLYKNILLIDDDSDDADVFIEAVNSLDRNITCTAQTNPIKALEYLASLEILPDLIFLDYNMPVLNGNEFLAKMRVVKRLAVIPVIVYSTYSQAAAETLCIVHENEQYITKPSNFNDLKVLLDSILE